MSSSDVRTHGLRATVLTFLLVALAAATGWALAPNGAAAVRAGSHVAGAVTKQAGPVASRATRGPLAAVLTKTGHQVAHTQRTLAAELPAANGSHGGSVLVVLGAVLALALAGRRARLAPDFSPSLATGERTLARGRAPPVRLPAAA